MILPPGESLGGFRVIEALGIGGMAVVYRAEQLSLHREVALKVLSAELGKDEAFTERFRREGMHVSRLDHPNIIPIYDAGADKGRLFLAMRLVDGMTLAERIRADPLSATDTLQVLRPIADGLDCAHAAGLVHRDVKPQNILLTERDHPYLTDFGVAKSVDTVGMTDAGGFVGSVQYAAPEQILGTKTSAATDVYALTVVLYQCLTGTVPHAQYTQAGALFAHVNEPPPQLRLAEAKAFNYVIERGMAKDPADRYESAGDLVDGAKHALDELPSGYLRRRPTFAGAATLSEEALPQTAANVTTVRPHRSRRRRVAAVLVGLTGVGALVLALLLSGGRPAAASPTIARSGELVISYRIPWTPTRGAFASAVVTPRGAAARTPIELRWGAATMAAGALGNSAAIPGGPPPALVRRFRHAPASRGRLADGAAVASYEWVLTDGRTVDVWVIPTARRDLAIICSAPRAPGAALRQCAAMATRARVSGVPLLAVGRDVGLAHSLQRAAVIASGSRHALATDHGAGPWPHGKVTSTAIADARAMMALRKLDIPARYRDIVSGLAASFAAEADALRALVDADRAHDQKRYKVASHAVENADRQLKAASERAVGAGLLKAAFARLTVPAWPVAVTPQGGTNGGSQSSNTSTATTPSSLSTYIQPSPPQTTQTTQTTTTATYTTTTASPATPIH